MKKKPLWWPECPYPEEVFPLDLREYSKIVPDPDKRSALSGALGRFFWQMAERQILERWQEAIEDSSE
jgi:hypothetical protein